MSTRTFSDSSYTVSERKAAAITLCMYAEVDAIPDMCNSALAETNEGDVEFNSPFTDLNTASNRNC